MHACEYGCDTPYQEFVVYIEEVTHAIEKLDLNKPCGSDGICSEHLKYASNVLVPLLAMCFTSFISHGFLPETLLSVMLVPVIKDKAGKISSKDNYRPIALASVISKLVEVIMLDRIEMYMITIPNQFGFKMKHGTDQCIYVLKEIIDLYRKLSEELHKCNVGCNLNGLLINHIMYADDLVLTSPSSAGLSQLLRECEKFGTRHDVKYNAMKSAVMIYRSMTLKECTIPNFNLNGLILHVVASYKYLEHYITDDLSDDDDINQSINQSIFYSISDTYSVIHIIHSKFTINKKQRRGEKDMFEAIQLISNIPWTIKFKLQSDQ